MGLEPRELNPAVPPVCEAVCLKAMALEPRSAKTGQALALDIERWLADGARSRYIENLFPSASAAGSSAISRSWPPQRSSWCVSWSACVWMLCASGEQRGCGGQFRDGSVRR